MFMAGKPPEWMTEYPWLVFLVFDMLIVGFWGLVKFSIGTIAGTSFKLLIGTLNILSWMWHLAVRFVATRMFNIS